jgi:peptide/nickel transport system permease protein
MTREGRAVLTIAPHVSALPGIAILLVVAFNLVGDSLRDALDPRRRLLRAKFASIETKRSSN